MTTETKTNLIPIAVLDDGTTWGGLGHIAYLTPSQAEQASEGELDDIDTEYPINDLNNILHLNLSSFEMDVVLELARIALADADTFDYLADTMDVDDESMKIIQEKLAKHLDTVTS